MSGTYYGKYRGIVKVNNDNNDNKVNNDNDDGSAQRGRLKVEIQGFYKENGGLSPWALPCVPYAGEGVGLFLIPPIDANVWIEFENGDPDYPIWTGCFWSDPRDKEATIIKAPEQDPNMKVLKTDIGTIAINDQKQIITIEAKIGKPKGDKQSVMQINMNANAGEIEINNGAGASIKLKGNTVSINNDGLEVT